MYQRWAQTQGLNSQLLESTPSSPGLRSATIKLQGKNAHKLSREGGAHRIQHKTRSRRQDRIHTSTATVAVLPVVNKTDFCIPDSEITIEPFRGQGPGGQHRNKTENAIKATHVPTGLQATIDGRSQAANKTAAVELLTARVSQVHQQQQTVNRQQLRAQQTIAERATAVRTYDVIRDVIRCENGTKVKGVKKVLDGKLDPLLD